MPQNEAGSTNTAGATTSGAIADFGHKLSAWAKTLDDTQQAMLIDLLAKAGGDVYGIDGANAAASAEGKEQDADDLSPLELDDFTHAVAGILRAGTAT